MRITASDGLDDLPGVDSANLRCDMTLQEVKLILRNRLETLTAARSYAVQIGDMLRVTELDGEIEETQTTLSHISAITG